MPKYYCDYCDIYLTHDSPSVRRSHNMGWKHIVHVKEYYSELCHDQAQSVIDQIAAAHTRPHGIPPMGGPPRPNGSATTPRPARRRVPAPRSSAPWPTPSRSITSRSARPAAPAPPPSAVRSAWSASRDAVPPAGYAAAAAGDAVPAAGDAAIAWEQSPRWSRRWATQALPRR
ncbi:hypothetical protein AMAG_13380 [Allomyces macrogynus ATCC 38327]|uniref:Matrin-type domain-containing protein n=1 Tax=Allomyces macrogynus (strain ATCC 38327) TaxID=578462 RepID=A0A0L0T2D1_ALLM3|nr:hypothetical protein AMAG_13380 [Allomyces macrogynus ATCC 38327]|eukprot:KNE68739.1 hypothetical protein AMAG_13380 [Allomyces macrogynus ATCC 38327]